MTESRAPGVGWTRRCRVARRSLATSALAALVALAVSGALAGERRSRSHQSRGNELRRIEQQIRTGKGLTKRILRDRRISPETRRTATDVDRLLAANERSATQLEARQRQFAARHQADIDALAALRRRALEIDERLDDARGGLLEANRADLDELRRTSEQARAVVRALRDHYDPGRKALGRP